MIHDFVDDVERWKISWKIKWVLAYDMPERLLDTLHSSKRDLYPAIYSVISILLTMPSRCYWQQAIYLSVQCDS
jgi:hypothetical protein